MALRVEERNFMCFFKNIFYSKVFFLKFKISYFVYLKMKKYH